MMPKEKSKMLKEIKENEDLIKFVKALTKEEIMRIKEGREYDEITPNTMTWKVALYNDSLRQQKRLIIANISKNLWNVQDITNNIKRLEEQISMGKIVEKGKNDMIMNEAEVRTLIQHMQWLRRGEVEVIPKKLAELRAIVGHKDVSKKVVMSVEEFDEYVKKIEDDFRDKGYVLFEGL